MQTQAISFHDTLQMTSEVWEEYRALYRSDPWEFALDICGFDRLVERFHKPIIYLFTHQTALLIDVLKGPLRSAVITKIKVALRKRGLDYNNPKHFDRIDRFTLKLNIRIFRGGGKSSCLQAAILWDITIDPDQSWALVTRDDDAAAEMCGFLARLVRGDPYRFFFPDRIPDNEQNNLTSFKIMLAGRSREWPQACVTAGGVDSGWVSKHFTRGAGDDLVGRENRSIAKLKVVQDFQANKDGLKMPEWEKPFYDFTTGTRWARKDDAYVLDNDPDCLTLYVMIEERSVPVTFANMMEAGRPTLPEWFDKEKIRAKKKEYLKNADGTLGPVALLANLFLTIHADAAKIFNDAMLDSRRFAWVEDDEFNPKRDTVARLENPHKPKTSKILEFPVRRLEIKAGADPAESMTGDPWAVTVLGRDPFAIHYQLETIKGQGAHGFLDALLYADERFNPDQIGVEKAAMQGWVLIAIEKDIRFANIIHKFVPVSTNQESKRSRAKNLVAAPLEMGELYLAPDPNPLPKDAKEWDPDDRHADDASIDATGTAMTLYRTPASGVTSKEVEEMGKLERDRYARISDKDFGMPVEDVIADDDWTLGDFDGDYDDVVGY